MQTKKEYYDYLPWLNFGVRDDFTEDQLFVTRISNIFATLVIITSIASAPFAGLGNFIAHAHQLTLCGVGISVLFLNYQRYLTTSKYLLLFAVPLIQFSSTFVKAAVLGGVSITILPFFLFAAIAFNDTTRKSLTMLFLFSLLVIGLIIEGFNFSLPLVYNMIVIIGGCSFGVIMVVKHIKSMTLKLSEKNEELEAINKELNDLVTQNELKSQLITVLGHDLRGPVHSFDKLAEKVSFLIRQGEYDELLKLADYFENSSKKLFYNLEKLLDWIKSQQRQISIQNQKIQVSQMLNEITQSLQRVYVNKNVSVEIDERLNYEIFGDRQIVSVILTNLIDNAIKYSSSTGIVHINQRVAEKSFAIEITNNGRSIDPGIIELAKAGKIGKSETGFGLGLNICIYLSEIIQAELLFFNIKDGTKVTLIIPQNQLALSLVKLESTLAEPSF